MSFRAAAEETGPDAIRDFPPGRGLGGAFSPPACFDRAGRRVALSEAGRVFFPLRARRLRPGHPRHRSAAPRPAGRRICGSRSNVTVAVRWLIPRLHRFPGRQPQCRRAGEYQPLRLGVRSADRRSRPHLHRGAGPAGPQLRSVVRGAAVPGLHAGRPAQWARPASAGRSGEPRFAAGLYGRQTTWHLWLQAAGVPGSEGPRRRANSTATCSPSRRRSTARASRWRRISWWRKT